MLCYKTTRFSKKYKLHDSKAATYWLAILAFLESSVFLLPVDVLYIPLLLRRPEKAYKYALIATIFSVLGGVFGWVIGAFAYKTIALPILTFYGKEEVMLHLQAHHNLKLIILMLTTSGLVHLPPIKLVNIFAGLVHVNILVFIVLNLISRSIRLYGLAWLISNYGENFLQKLRLFISPLGRVLSNLKILVLVLALLSSLVTLASFFMQYMVGLLPCQLCLVERKIFLLISMLSWLLLALLSYRHKAKLMLGLLGSIGGLLLVNLAVSFYHYGVERHFWRGPLSCSSDHSSSFQNSQDLLKALQQPFFAPCDIISGSFLKISLTSWSIVSCIILLVLVYNIGMFYRRSFTLS